MNFTMRPKTQDWVCYREVYLENQYDLPESFLPSDTIIDIGANIGCFAAACLARGAGKVVCYEPESSNFALLRENLAQWPGRTELHEAAVWHNTDPLRLAIHPDGYSAMHDVISFHGTALGVPVASAVLDTILLQHQPIRYLKLDCEGAEWPLLLTSQQLHLPQELAVELHYTFLADGLPSTALTRAKSALTAAGFTNQTYRDDPNPVGGNAMLWGRKP